MSLLEADRLEVVPPGAREPAISGFSLAIGRGEWVALAGPNGSGKSSLILALAGLWPSSGSLRLEGREFGPQVGAEARRAVAVIQQDPASQILQSTVYAEMAFALRNLGVGEAEIRDRVESSSDRLGLREELDREPSRLSAGRQQMVLVAAALATAPHLWIADEATAHMDLESKQLVHQALKAEVTRGASILWVTQDPAELRLASRVVTLGESHGPLISPRSAGPLTEEETLLRVRVSPWGPHGSDRPNVRIDRELAFDIGRRGMMALVGPNGVGKSVILAAIAGLDQNPQVVLDWKDALDAPPIAALQFPELQIFEENVSDEIAYASVARGRAREEALAEASKWLRKLEFAPENFLAERTWALSMGAKRLTEVIAALVTPSSLVILDEPTAGIDPRRRSLLGEILSELTLDRPVILATQDRDWLSDLRIRVTEITPTVSAKTPVVTLNSVDTSGKRP